MIYEDILRNSIKESLKRSDILGNYPKLKISKYDQTLNEYLLLKISNEEDIFQFENYHLLILKSDIIIFDSLDSLTLFKKVTNNLAYNMRNKHVLNKLKSL